MALKVKEEYKNKVIGFNGRSLPLGQRKDLDKLAELAVKSGDLSLLNLLEEIPSIQEIEEKKGKKLMEEIKKK
ncbi:hypothetical protein ETU08_00025 [Apibacter muscae]|uniref:hypothetical protein n=1 Tax=Apibacter muscae TaxID=2509004 RepID=UPI0011ABB129|nr:hypothetical protein [Apibacter muscae]TWP31880.1 hypothetical protein ETU08_00025 [Apibacter muscae]